MHVLIHMLPLDALYEPFAQRRPLHTRAHWHLYDSCSNRAADNNCFGHGLFYLQKKLYETKTEVNKAIVDKGSGQRSIGRRIEQDGQDARIWVGHTNPGFLGPEES